MKKETIYKLANIIYIDMPLFVMITAVWLGFSIIIPWNIVIFDLAAAEFHGIPWNITWNSMEPSCHLKWHPPSSMELGDI